MASQTATTDTTMAALVGLGLANGQNVTINAGAVVTVSASPSVLVGQVTINDGELFLDGENATNPIVFVGEGSEEINVNGAGILRSSLGWWECPTTGDGTANQTFDVSTYFADAIIDADVFSGCWVETGRRINYDGGSGVAPAVGDWLFATANNDIHGRITEVSGDEVSGYVVVRFLTGALADNDAIELHTLQDNAGPDYQKSWNAVADGADILESGTFQEFGNAYQNSVDNLSALGSGIAGFGYSQAWDTNALNFGDGTAGFIPPNGARLRLPMVHFATGTTTSIATSDAVMQTAAASRYELETVNGGDCYLTGVSLGSAQFEDNLGTEFQASYCAANHAFGVYGALGRPTYDHCIFTSGHVYDLRSAARSVPAIADLVSGADVRDCLGLFINDAAETTQFGGQTSLGVNMERVIQISNSNSNEFEVLRIAGFTATDVVVIGTQLVITTATDADIRLLKTQRNIQGGVAGSDQVFVNASANNVKITGWEILRGSAPDDSKIAIVDSSNVAIRGFHFIDDKFDNEALGGTQAGEFASVGGLCADVTFARCWINRGSPNEFVFAASGTTKNLTVLNCSAEYNGEVEPDGINTSFRGLHSGSGNMGASSGLETDYPGTAGAHFGDVFESNTRGYIYYRNVPGTPEYPIAVLSGNPKFTKDGDVDTVLGDQWEVDMGYIARGHTSFRGVLTTGRATTNTAEGVDGWTGVDIDFQYDTGGGFNGTWLDLRTGANLTAIGSIESGIRMKLRFTGTATQTNGQAVTIHTNTTIAAQVANLHPIDQTVATLRLTGLKNPTEIRLFDAVTRVPVAGTEDVTSGVYEYAYNYVADQDVDIAIVSLGYVIPPQLRVTLGSVDQTIPVQQQLDRQYENL